MHNDVKGSPLNIETEIIQNVQANCKFQIVNPN